MKEWFIREFDGFGAILSLLVILITFFGFIYNFAILLIRHGCK